MLQFATCDRKAALGFLKKLYPDGKITDSADSVGPLLDLVKKDIVRIQDPMMHSPAQVVAGKKYLNDMEAEVLKACEILKTL